MISLHDKPLNDDLSAVYKQIGVRLYFDYFTKETYINKNYWFNLPKVAKDALIRVYEDIQKENNIDGQHNI